MSGIIIAIRGGPGSQTTVKKAIAFSKETHDLRLERLDLVIMDLQPATVALALGELKLAGQGLNQQRFAIAIPQGANSLKAEINRALLTLQNEGRVSELAGIYLGLKPEDVISPPTPEPTPEEVILTSTLEPTPENATITSTLEPTPESCIDAMKFVEDLNYDDEDLNNFPKVDPGEAFVKGLRVRNTGSCTWTSAYFIKYVRGNVPAAQMQGQPTAIKSEVNPGQTYDIYVNLVAPEAAGKYVGYWQMFNNDNKSFGQTLWIAVEVRATGPVEPTATVTAAATATPTPKPTTKPTSTITPEPTATVTATATEVPLDLTPTEKPGSDLRDTIWVLAGYLADLRDEELTGPIQDVEVNLLFDEDDTFNGYAGCNTYNGRYVTDGKQIIFDGFMITQAICELPEGLMDQEVLYLSLLESVEEYRFNDEDQLELIRYMIKENNEREEKILLVFNGLRAEQL